MHRIIAPSGHLRLKHKIVDEGIYDWRNVFADHLVIISAEKLQNHTAPILGSSPAFNNRCKEVLYFNIALLRQHFRLVGLSLSVAHKHLIATDQNHIDWY